jgi:CubicO group peptidase (beta-lactamase class C family)
MQTACIPATSGLMSAQAIAKHYAALAEGGIDGVAMLSPESLKTVTTAQTLADGSSTGSGLGYGFGTDHPVRGNRRSAFGHGGHGGSEGFYDPELDLGFGFARNRLRDPSNTPTAALVADLVRKHLVG